MAQQLAVPGRVLETPTLTPDEALLHFAKRLATEADPSDVYTDQKSGKPGFVLMHPRAPDAFAKEHVPGAINLHYKLMDAKTTASLRKDTPIVVYCAGVHCNAS